MTPWRPAAVVALCLPAASLACGSADPAVVPVDAAFDAVSDSASPWKFAPSNIPAAALEGSLPEDLIIGGAGCDGRQEVEVDTDQGTWAGCPALVSGVHYR